MSRHVSNTTRSRLVYLAPTREDLVDAAFSLLLVALALYGFRTTYSGWLFLTAGVAGTLLGLLIAHLANALRQPLIALAGMSAAVFFLLGGAVALHGTAIAGVLPSGATLRGLADQSVHGWKDLLTTLPPVDGSGPLLVLPYLLGLLGGVSALSLARRTRPPLSPIAAPLLVLMLVILLGSNTPAALLLQGAFFGVFALAWAAVRGHRLRPPLQNGSGRTTRFATAVALLAVAAAGAAVVGPHVPGVGDNQRLVLRNYVAPPFDVGQYPSPLAAFRRYTKPADQTLYSTTLFHISGLPSGTLVRIATLDDYDGDTWRASNQQSAPGVVPDTFQRVGTSIDNPNHGSAISYAVTIGKGYSGVWLPDVGALIELDFTGTDAQAHSDYFRYNLATGTGVVPDGLRSGDSYHARAVTSGSAPLRSSDVLASSGAIVTANAAFLHSQAVQWSGGSGGPTQRVLALARYLYSRGKYSDGEPPNQHYLPGHYEGRLQRFVNDPTDPQIVGDDEQYAAAYALMINSLGIPARVVLGAKLEAGGDVKGRDVHAWVEVQLADGTWRTVPTDTFMNRDSRPQQHPPQPQHVAPNVVVPPPSQVKPRSTLADADAADTRSSLSQNKRAAARHSGSGGVPGWIIAAARWGGPPVGLLALVCGLIIGLKARRRHARRTRGTPANRLARGWHEILDHARDLGASIPYGHTRREQALLLAAHDVAPLARAADAHVFGADDPTAETAVAYWLEVDAARKRMSSGVGTWARVRAALSIASLRRPAVERAGR